MPTLMMVLVGSACVTTVISAMGKLPMYVPVGILCVVGLIEYWPK